MEDGLIRNGTRLRKSFAVHDGNTVVTVYDLRNAYFQAGDPRRRLERLDSQLIGNDRTEIQNVPQFTRVAYFPGRPWRRN
jgi:hypothetical protein